MEKKNLYAHTLHPHIPKNVNLLDRFEKEAGGINVKIAMLVTKILSNMYCAYFFVVLALLGFPGFRATAPQYVQWVSQTFIQLVALSILSVGQDLLSRHQQLQADEQFETTKRSFHEIEQMVFHLNAQDDKILTIEKKIDLLLTKNQRLKIEQTV